MRARGVGWWLVVLLAAGSCAGRGEMTRDDQVTGEGELRAGEVGFVVRELAGPGSMGPREVSPSSAAALDAVRAWMAAHPAERLRVEVAVNPRMMSGMPDARWGAHLARKVADALVARGVECARLEPLGILDDAPDAPGERVRFFVVGRGPARPAGEARDPWAEEDPCR